MAYYVVQVEQALERYERLAQEIGDESHWGRLDTEEKEMFTRWLAHGRLMRAERVAARATGREAGLCADRQQPGWGDHRVPPAHAGFARVPAES